MGPFFFSSLRSPSTIMLLFFPFFFFYTELVPYRACVRRVIISRESVSLLYNVPYILCKTVRSLRGYLHRICALENGSRRYWDGIACACACAWSWARGGRTHLLLLSPPLISSSHPPSQLPHHPNPNPNHTLKENPPPPLPAAPPIFPPKNRNEPPPALPFLISQALI